MRTPAMITEDEGWMGDLTGNEIASIHECMKEYAKEVLDQFVETYWNDINVHDRVIDQFKRQQV